MTALILVIFGALSLLFARELAGQSALGRFLSGSMAFFWLMRLPIQLFYYDADVKREYRLAHYALMVAIIFLTWVYTVAAMGGYQ